ncbi:hypothetical protein ACJIZ3_015765 [Penstemon smallii]|uniref:RING-type domain-containing protein n=1 Tax=Penstemon smallii TaxID=265156 RepID=A0ABD3RNE6_9LAMI
MKVLTRFFSNKTQNPIPKPESSSHTIGEMTEGETIAGNADIANDGTTLSGEGERTLTVMEKPPDDDVCPICFGNFVVPCRASCGHWYCGSCILQYWDYCSAFKPCKCPMCLKLIPKLTPEISLYQRHEVEITKVLQNIDNYNRLFVEGISGVLLRIFSIPLLMKRMLLEMMDPDRPGINVQKLRCILILIGVLYTYSPIDFLHIGDRNIIRMCDYSAYAISTILYLVGLYIHFRRQRNVRELAGVQAGHD